MEYRFRIPWREPKINVSVDGKKIEQDIRYKLPNWRQRLWSWVKHDLFKRPIVINMTYPENPEDYMIYLKVEEIDE